jgi:hypothetical protein
MFVEHVEKPSGRDGTQGMNDREVCRKWHSKIKWTQFFMTKPPDYLLPE